MVIRFHSSRPSSMLIEKSMDDGATWTPWQYYGTSCADFTALGAKTLSDIAEGEAINTVICTKEYSHQTPYVGGQVIFDIVNDRFSKYLGENMVKEDALLYENGFERDHLAEFLSFTDLRIRLFHPATNGNEDTKKEEDLITFYYAISDIQIPAS